MLARDRPPHRRRKSRHQPVWAVQALARSLTASTAYAAYAAADNEPRGQCGCAACVGLRGYGPEISDSVFGPRARKTGFTIPTASGGLRYSGERKPGGVMCVVTACSGEAFWPARICNRENQLLRAELMMSVRCRTSRRNNWHMSSLGSRFALWSCNAVAQTLQRLFASCQKIKR